MSASHRDDITCIVHISYRRRDARECRARQSESLSPRLRKHQHSIARNTMLLATAISLSKAEIPTVGQISQLYSSKHKIMPRYTVLFIDNVAEHSLHEEWSKLCGQLHGRTKLSCSRGQRCTLSPIQCIMFMTPFIISVSKVDELD